MTKSLPKILPGNRTAGPVLRSIGRPLLVLAAVCALPGGGLSGSELSEDVIRQGHESLKKLKKLGDMPWYDAESDSIRRIDPDRLPRRSSWSNDFYKSLLGGLIRVVAWTVIAATFIGIVILLLRYMFEKNSLRSASKKQSQDKQADKGLVERLPVKLHLPATDFLAEARRLYEEGEYSKAIVYVFCYQLVELERCHLVQLTRGKTNRQYLREIQSRESLCGIVERTMVAFEDVVFGKYTIDRRRFESCWNGLPEFRNLIQRMET